MSTSTSPLDNVRIASPCSADWNEMYGDDRKRFCGECKLNVFNLSGMTRADAEALILNTEGRLCVRFFQRTDGTIITKDCPVGWAGVKHRARVFATAAASLIMAVLTGVFFVSLFSGKKTVVGPGRYELMGAIAVSDSNKDNEPRSPVMGNIASPSAKKKTMTEIKVSPDVPVVRKTS